MKRIVLAVLLVSAFCDVHSQTDVEKKLKLDMWTNASKEFKATEVPEKWKNESAVVLALEREYIGDFSIKMTARYYVEKLNTHFRIKLLDKAAVVDFSDLSFDDKSIRTNMFGRASTYKVIGIKVIKPNGSEKEVDLTKAVKADITSENELKIPIPDLEPGDIIDYYIAVKDESLQMPNFGDEILLESKYPIVFNTFSFSIPHQFNFYSTAYNGAPNFTKKVVKNDEIYSLKNEMQEKAPDLLWDYEYRTAPHVRYKIGNSPSKPNPKVVAEDMLNSFGLVQIDIGAIEDFVKLSLKKEQDQKKLTREIFYLLRNPIYKKAYFDIEQGDPLNSGYTPNKYFYIMDRFLRAHKIQYEVLLASPRWYGPIDDVVSFGNCDLIIKVKTTPPIYLSRPSPFAMPNDIPYVLEGMDAVTNSGGTLRPIPVTTVDQNVETTSFTIDFMKDDITKLHVKRKTVVKGLIKKQHQYSVFTNYDYLKAYDQPKYMVESSRLMGNIIKEYNKEETKFEQRKVQDYNERDTRLKEEIERDTDGKVSDYSLTVKSIGMWDNAPDTDYEDEFTLESMTKKVGPNIIFELGKLIGGQTDIQEKKQLTRTRDIYMDYARTFAFNVTLTIPEGFDVEGLENLNKKIETEAGGFVSTAAVNGNVLTVTAKKYYNKIIIPAADWSKITDFLPAAVEFRNAKVLLKKK